MNPSDPVYTEDYKDYTIRIMPDDDPCDPRDWDNPGRMICWHRRYRLGDPHDYGEPDDFALSFVPETVRCTEAMTFSALMEKYVYPKAVVLPLYLYDHSGLRMNTTGFHCPWDSGQVGFIYVTLEDIRKEWGIQRVSRQLRERVEAALRAEVDTYDDYLCGHVYGYVVEKDGDVIESCWNFPGDYKGYCLSEARSAADFAERQAYPLLDKAGLLEPEFVA